MCRSEGEFCKTCLANNCNEKTEFQKCRICSSADTVSCIRSPGSVQSKACRNYVDECFVHVKDDVVRRGCIAEGDSQLVSDCGNTDVCEKCSGGMNCNNKIVDGEFCFTCDSENDANCRQNLNISMRTQCKLGVQMLGCYLFDDGGNWIRNILV